MRQYAPVGAAAEVSLRAALELIARTARPELVSFGQVLAARAAAVEEYRDTIAGIAGRLQAGRT